MRRYGGDPDVRIEVITLQMRLRPTSPAAWRTRESSWPEFDGPTCRMLEGQVAALAG